MTPIHILMAEDEAALGLIVKESLESRGFEVSLCENGELALQYYRQQVPDVVVLDVMMPKKDGFLVAREIRETNPHIPIIFLTAKSRTEDVVEGFGYGANDYLKKPFSMEELIVRIQALVRRKEWSPPVEPAWISVGRYAFNPVSQILQWNSEEELLTHREAQVLLHLVKNKNELTERKALLKTLWGNDDFFSARSMDVFISKLRKKLARDPDIQILNIRGYGYKLVVV